MHFEEAKLSIRTAWYKVINKGNIFNNIDSANIAFSVNIIEKPLKRVNNTTVTCFLQGRYLQWEIVMMTEIFFEWKKNYNRI